MSKQQLRSDRSRNKVLKVIYDDYHPFLHAYAMSLCKNSQFPDLAADDLIQELYCKLLTNWSSFYSKYRQVGNKKAYLLTVLKNKHTDQFRKCKRLREGYNSYKDTHLANAPHTTEIEAENKLEEIIVQIKNANLSAKEYEVVQCCMKNWKHQQIADYLSIPKNTVTTHWNRAKRKLRAALKATS